MGKERGRVSDAELFTESRKAATNCEKSAPKSTRGFWRLSSIDFVVGADLDEEEIVLSTVRVRDELKQDAQVVTGAAGPGVSQTAFELVGGEWGANGSSWRSPRRSGWRLTVRRRARRKVLLQTPQERSRPGAGKKGRRPPRRRTGHGRPQILPRGGPSPAGERSISCQRTQLLRRTRCANGGPLSSLPSRAGGAAPADRSLAPRGESPALPGEEPTIPGRSSPREARVRPPEAEPSPPEAGCSPREAASRPGRRTVRLPGRASRLPRPEMRLRRPASRPRRGGLASRGGWLASRGERPPGALLLPPLPPPPDRPALRGGSIAQYLETGRDTSILGRGLLLILRHRVSPRDFFLLPR